MRKSADAQQTMTAENCASFMKQETSDIEIDKLELLSVIYYYSSFTRNTPLNQAGVDFHSKAKRKDRQKPTFYITPSGL